MFLNTPNNSFFLAKIDFAKVSYHSAPLDDKQEQPIVQVEIR